MPDLSRRGFLRSTTALAATAVLPVPASGQSPELWAITTSTLEEPDYIVIGRVFAEALARAMAETQELVYARIFNAAFEGDFETDSLRYRAQHRHSAYVVSR